MRRRLGGREGAQVGGDQTERSLDSPLPSHPPPLTRDLCLQFLDAGWWLETCQAKAQGGTSMLRSPGVPWRYFRTGL